VGPYSENCRPCHVLGVSSGTGDAALLFIRVSGTGCASSGDGPQHLYFNL
jgi:hypothetical protein